MNLGRIFRLLIPAVFCFPQIFYTMGSTPVKDIPLKVCAPKIQDGEYCKIVRYVRGEKDEEWFQVSRVNEKDKTVDFYGFIRKADSTNVVPADFSNYNSMCGTIDMQTGSLLKYKRLEPDQTVKGEIGEEYRLSGDASEIFYQADYWDGYEVKKRTSRVKVRKGYPVWEFIQLMNYGPRFLDLSRPGIVYASKLDVMKEVIPIAFIPQKKEVITTPAGKFNTIKIVFAIADPFLAKLSEPFMKELTIWMEDSPRALMVKGVNPAGDVYVVEEISNVLNQRL